VRLLGDVIQPATLLSKYRRGIPVESWATSRLERSLRPLGAAAGRLGRELAVTARLLDDGVAPALNP
jgi:hypothetical protein